MKHSIKCLGLLLLAFLTLEACSSSDDTIKSKSQENSSDELEKANTKVKKGLVLLDDNGKIGNIFNNNGNEIGSVNKYLWQASLEILYFLPIKSADPFSGIISFGEGKVPGGSQIYDATVYVSDPALDARSLNVTLRTTSGLVSLKVKLEVENAILSRARQLRLNDSDF